MYFADDTTLISRNVPSLLQQLELVQVYCQGSGAKLNQSKCVVFALNKNAPLPTVPGYYYVLPDGETVKFLGVMFGRHDTTAQVIETLDEKLQEFGHLASARADVGRSQTVSKQCDFVNFVARRATL